tara:strand:- start:384 stop:533 length:150 start_codon:yes stop_codon:yes gene_type:complete
LKITQHRLRLEAELTGTGVSAAQNAVLLFILERAGFVLRPAHPEHGRTL